MAAHKKYISPILSSITDNYLLYILNKFMSLSLFLSLLLSITKMRMDGRMKWRNTFSHENDSQNINSCQLFKRSNM